MAAGRGGSRIATPPRIRHPEQTRSPAVCPVSLNDTPAIGERGDHHVSSGPCCARADRCGRRAPQRDNDGDPTGLWVGAQLVDGDLLWCRTCVTRLRVALNELPRLVIGVSAQIVK